MGSDRVCPCDFHSRQLRKDLQDTKMVSKSAPVIRADRTSDKTVLPFLDTVQLLFTISFIVTLITNWKLPEVRPYLILSLVCFLTVGASSGVYFVKEILTFSKMPATTPATLQLRLRANRWLKWTTIRNVLQFVSLVLLLIALDKLA